MLKTIKTTKKLTFIELLENRVSKKLQGKYYEKYESDCGNYEVRMTPERLDYVKGLKKLVTDECSPNMPFNTTFTVEIEEPIKDVTLLEKAVYVHKNETLIKDYNTSIKGILISNHEGSVSEIYALIDGRLQLVWERDEDE